MSRARLDTVENRCYAWRARAETGVFASFGRHVGQFHERRPSLDGGVPGQTPASNATRPLTSYVLATFGGFAMPVSFTAIAPFATGSNPSGQLRARWHARVGATIEDSSGLSGCSGWDPNNDGALEILYADQPRFVILDGRTIPVAIAAQVSNQGARRVDAGAILTVYADDDTGERLVATVVLPESRVALARRHRGPAHDRGPRTVPVDRAGRRGERDRGVPRGQQ